MAPVVIEGSNPSLSAKSMMGNERLAIGRELAFEACRLAETSDFRDNTHRAFDFGSTPTLAYRDKPWGLISISYRSQYVTVDGNPYYAPSVGDIENPQVACITVETRYRSLRTTGEILCDRECYCICTNGDIEATLSKGELTDAQNIRQGDPFSGASFEDKSSMVFGVEDFFAVVTPEQERNNRLLEKLSDELHNADRERSEEIAAQIACLEDSGERAIHMPLNVSTADLKEFLGRLRLLDATDKLGQIELISIVDKSDITD